MARSSLPCDTPAVSAFFDELAGDSRQIRARSNSFSADDDRFSRNAASDFDTDRFRRRPSTDLPDRGLLDDFDEKPSQQRVENPDDAYVPADTPAWASRRDSHYRNVVKPDGRTVTRHLPASPSRTPEEEEAIRLRMLDHYKYLHGGRELRRDEIDTWDAEDPRRRDKNSSAFKIDAPEAGWDQPRIGRFRSALSWLGNKLTFGKFGGKDYRARQEALGRRQRVVKNAFDNQMNTWDEVEFDQTHSDAISPDPLLDEHGGKYLGKHARPVEREPGENSFFYDLRRKRQQRADITNNPRYTHVPDWLKESKYASKEWDKLVGSYADTGVGGKPRNILAPPDQW